MYKYLLFLLLLLGNLHLSAQYQKAYLDETGHVQVEHFSSKFPVQLRNGEDGFNYVEGFPKGFKAAKANKNFRNVSLADLDGDGADEIIVALASKLYVFKAGSLLWEKNIIGIGIYPPSIADIDNNGTLDIIQVTGGNQQVGGIYVLDASGNDLPGWPISLNDNWILNAPGITDLDDDGQMEIIVNELSNPKGKVHVLKSNGQTFSENWPVQLDNTSAVTPSVADIDRDGEKEIVFCSTTTIYVMGLDGKPEEGWPIENPDTKFSYQSPILVDFEDDGFFEIVGATHGNAPEYYAFNYDGTYRSGWPVAVPENTWTFSAPAYFRDGEDQYFFMSRPIFSESETKEMFFAFDTIGQLHPGFPLFQNDGSEGLITIADVDDDNEMEVLFSSNSLDPSGRGYIHAYELDGSQEVEGFPIRPRGFTYMNGATIGDINGDGKMNIVTLSYTIDQAGNDSLYLHAYDLGVSNLGEKIAWGTYKGSNRRDGRIPTQYISSTSNLTNAAFDFSISPNPISGATIPLQINSTSNIQLTFQIFDIVGKLVKQTNQHDIHVGVNFITMPFGKFPNGTYLVTAKDEEGNRVSKKIIRSK